VKRLLDILLGRSDIPPARSEGLIALSSAVVTMEAQLGFRRGEEAALVFRPVESPYFDRTSQELDDLLAVTARDAGTRYRDEVDRFRYRWLILSDPDFEDLITTVHMLAQTLHEHGFGEQLLAAVFRFTSPQGQPFYWIYQYKRGRFSPFAPQGDQQRDHALELRLSNALRRELPLEDELERWFPLWGIPF
jgi:hypothetical protein